MGRSVSDAISELRQMVRDKKEGRFPSVARVGVGKGGEVISDCGAKGLEISK